MRHTSGVAMRIILRVNKKNNDIHPISSMYAYDIRYHCPANDKSNHLHRRRKLIFQSPDSDSVPSAKIPSPS